MKIEITNDNTKHVITVGPSLLTDEEIKEYSLNVYDEMQFTDEHKDDAHRKWKKLTNSFMLGAKWARDTVVSRQLRTENK
jgi:hypothetical protein